MRTKSKFKRGTVGYDAERLVKKFGTSLQGIQTLVFALEEATGADHLQYYVKTGKFYGEFKMLTETPGYLKICREIDKLTTKWEANRRTPADEGDSAL